MWVRQRSVGATYLIAIHLHLPNQLPRGKVVGGSSAVNAMVYMRGHPNDYDSWASSCDCPTQTPRDT